jgi:hypothetical protein
LAVGGEDEAQCGVIATLQDHLKSLRADVSVAAPRSAEDYDGVSPLGELLREEAVAVMHQA